MEIIEVPVFTKNIVKMLSDDEYKALLDSNEYNLLNCSVQEITTRGPNEGSLKKLINYVKEGLL